MALNLQVVGCSQNTSGFLFPVGLSDSLIEVSNVLLRMES